MKTNMETKLQFTKSEGTLSSLALEKINASLPAGDQIYQMLRTAILEMQLMPGSAISEAEIGSKIGASRTPVREALLRLREEGLIHTLPSRGNFVSTISRSRILEAQFLREGLELANVRRVAEFGLSQEMELELRQNLEKQTAATADEDYSNFHKLDDEFHLLLARATGFERAALVLEREKMQLDRMRSLSLKVEGRLQFLLGEHRAIFAAVLERNIELARDRTRHHCRSILDVLEDLSERHEEYFS